MNISQAMHEGVSWVTPDMTLSKIAALMREKDVGAVPVGENDRLIGMVTDRDIVIRGLANGRDPTKLTARDVMTPGIVYCHANERVEDAIRVMETRQIRRLPVIDEDKRMVGMLSLGDLSHCPEGHLTAEVMSAVSAHHG